MNHTVLINPKSGNIFQRRKLKPLINMFKEQRSYDVHVTQSKEHAQSIAKVAYKNGCRSFLIFGGDGTIFDTLNALYPKAFRDPPTFGLFPYGSGNSMTLDFAKTGKRTLEALIAQEKMPCDVLELKTQKRSYYFANLVSLGYVADVARVRNRYFNWMGPLGYVLAVILTLPVMKPKAMTIIHDQDVLDKTWSFTSFNNTRFTGGKMMMAPHANPSDGKIASLLVGPKSRSDILKAFPKIFTGTHTDLNQVAAMQAESIAFQDALAQPIVIDGEMCFETPLSITIHRHALSIYAFSIL